MHLQYNRQLFNDTSLQPCISLPTPMPRRRLVQARYTFLPRYDDDSGGEGGEGDGDADGFSYLSVSLPPW